MNISEEQSPYQTANTEAFRRKVLSPGFRFYLLFKLPAAWFSGVKIQELDYNKTIVSIRYSWFSQNPFRSTYFACLAMAAEMSTGLPCLMAIQKRRPSVSMLVVGMESSFYKKAVGTTTFVCNDNKAIFDCIERTINASGSETIVLNSTGYNETGEKVADFRITWSFHVRK